MEKKRVYKLLSFKIDVKVLFQYYKQVILFVGNVGQQHLYKHKNILN